MPWKIDDLDTPSVLIDLDRVEDNLRRAQDYADAHGLKLRPHIKTHKIPELARRQVELGAVGITCQKLGEVEAMADGGLRDILLTFNLLGRRQAASPGGARAPCYGCPSPSTMRWWQASSTRRCARRGWCCRC